MFENEYLCVEEVANNMKMYRFSQNVIDIFKGTYYIKKKLLAYCLNINKN